MEHDENIRRQADRTDNLQRNDRARGGLGANRPQRRITDGHTQPCVECGVVDWLSLIHISEPTRLLSIADAVVWV